MPRALRLHLPVQGSGFRVQGSGFRVQVSGFRVQGSGLRVQGSGFRVQGSGFSTVLTPPRDSVDQQHVVANREDVPAPLRLVPYHGVRVRVVARALRVPGSAVVPGSGYPSQGKRDSRELTDLYVEVFRDEFWGKGFTAEQDL